MALSPGTSIGHYDVTSLLGEGGMGQVWQATDTQLNRQVALKIVLGGRAVYTTHRPGGYPFRDVASLRVRLGQLTRLDLHQLDCSLVLPDAFADDPDRFARFTLKILEAQILASLNHPNIAAIYGIEESEGTRALVLELVEGPTLADRIAQGAIPLEDALPIARQIAEALEAAHEAGVIHRDLKPANVKVKADGTVKVLDFGLAKALDPVQDADPSNSPTLTAAATQMGMIMGTAAYMSPEQARGKPVDKRADIWAFGAVVYEMLTGRRAFEGDDVSLTLASVMKSEPELDALPADTGSAVRITLRRCLEKDVRDRVRDIGDVRHILEGRFESDTVGESPAGPLPPTSPAWRAPLQWVVAAAIGALVAGAVGWWRVAPAPSSAPVLRLDFALPPDQVISQASRQDIAVSRDGSHVAFATPDGLWVRALDNREATSLVRGGVRVPFFSPDGLWVGFWDPASSQVRKVEVDGGAAVTLGGEGGRAGVFSAWWSEYDTIVLAAGPDGLWSLPGTGGDVEPLVDGNLTNVQVLPGGDWVLVSDRIDTESYAVVAVSLETGVREVLIEEASAPRYLPTGHLVFVRDNTLFGTRFDLESRTVSGGYVPLVEQVASDASNGVAQFAVADTGLLVYVPGGQQATQLVWVEPDARTTDVAAEPLGYSDLRLSPDGRSLAVHSMDDQNDIWTYEFETGAMTRRTFEPGEDETPVWSPDSTSVAYTSAGPGARTLIRLGVAGRADAEALWQDPRHFHAADWSPDGTTIVLDVQDQATDGDVYLLRLDGDRIATPLLQSVFNERSARVSPDGRWLAYASNESGRDEVYVQAFPELGGKRQVSTEGGVQPVWSRDGAELFFRGPDDLMAVSISGEDAPTVTAARPLFDDRFIRAQSPGNHTSYDVAPDGRFLMLENPAGLDSIHVVANWFEELKTRVPLP